MNKETITWVYVCDPPQFKDDPEEGTLYVARVNAESLMRNTTEGWVSKDTSVWWYRVNRETLRINCSSDDIFPDDKDCTKNLAEALMLDLSNIPIPTMDDEKPIVVIQTISQSINYYIEE